MKRYCRTKKEAELEAAKMKRIEIAYSSDVRIIETYTEEKAKELREEGFVVFPIQISNDKKIKYCIHNETE